MGLIVDVPGHRTDALGAAPRVEKTRILAIVLNKSKLPFNVRGVRIKPGRKGAIADWQILQSDTVVRQWLQAKALEVVEEREIASEEREAAEEHPAVTEPQAPAEELPPTEENAEQPQNP